METTQAGAPAQAQVQQPVHPIHQEAQDLASLTKFVEDNPDNDPDHPEDSTSPRAETGDAVEEQGEQASPQTTSIEIDEEEPLFEIPADKHNPEPQKVSLKSLKEGNMMKRDYMRQMQEIQREKASVQDNIQKAVLENKRVVAQQLEGYKQALIKTAAPELQNIDWNKLANEDPAEFVRASHRANQLTQTLNAINSEIEKTHKEVATVEEKRRSEQGAKTWDILSQDIPGWGEDSYKNLMKAAIQDYGIDGERVSKEVDAGFFKALNDAVEYRKLQKAKPEINKRVVAVPKVIKPGSAEKPNPKEDVDRSFDRLKKTGKGEDFVNWYTKKQK